MARYEDLHDAMIAVIEEDGGGSMHVKDIAAEILEKNLWKGPRRITALDGAQVASRARRYPHLFDISEGRVTLRSATAARPSQSGQTASTPAATEIAIEKQWTDMVRTDPRPPAEAQRREQKLVLAYRDHLASLGHETCRQRIVPSSESGPLFTDLFDKTTRTLFEAKGSIDRGAIRMAIGQLADYRHFIADELNGVAVLLPSMPDGDIRDLLASLGIALVFPDGDSFGSLPAAAAT